METVAKALLYTLVKFIIMQVFKICFVFTLFY